MSGRSHAWPEGFGCLDGELAVAGQPVSHWIAQAGGTPLFLYDRALIERRIAQLRAALPSRVALHYAIKANPMPELVAWMADKVDGFDVASGGELTLAREAGMAGSHVSIAGPGKTERDLTIAIEADALINLESEREAERAAAIGIARGKPVRVAIRVNPDFELKGSGMRMGGGAKPFGVDAARVPALIARLQAAPFLFEGLHLYAGSQALDAGAIATMQRQTLDYAASLKVPLRHLNIGGGFGVPYAPGDTPLDLAAVGEALAQALDAVPLLGTQIVVELGRYLVAEAGVYLTRIIDRKRSHDSIFLVVDGGLHHQLAASGNFGQVIRRNYPIAVASAYDRAPTETVSVVGCLCTPLDRLGDKVALPEAAEGDVIAVFLAGAYGRSASPSRFLGHPEPFELLV
jgi:diaminopimelate decarboxylase